MPHIFYNGEKYFPILNVYDSDWVNLSTNISNLFEVDELMAIPISYLNNKGYFTEACCSGHVIGALCCEVADNEDIDEFSEEGSLVSVQHIEEDGADYMYWLGSPIYEAYILFKNRIRFPSIPDGWEYDAHCGRLSCIVSASENPMTYYKNISAALEVLMDWITQLPSI